VFKDESLQNCGKLGAWKNRSSQIFDDLVAMKNVCIKQAQEPESPNGGGGGYNAPANNKPANNAGGNYNGGNNNGGNNNGGNAGGSYNGGKKPNNKPNKKPNNNNRY